MINRRDFLNGVLATGTTLAASALSEIETRQLPASPAEAGLKVGRSASVIDFRYAPVKRQTAFCFPDDPHKSLVNETGQLRYGYKFGSSTLSSPLKIGFALYGMQPGKVLSQQLESPAVPIVRTVIEHPGVSMVLTTFAKNDSSEGRVDNVIVVITAHTGGTVNIELPLEFDPGELFDFEIKDQSFFSPSAVRIGGKRLCDRPEAGTGVRQPSQRETIAGAVAGLFQARTAKGDSQEQDRSRRADRPFDSRCLLSPGTAADAG